MTAAQYLHVLHNYQLHHHSYGAPELNITAPPRKPTDFGSEPNTTELYAGCSVQWTRFALWLNFMNASDLYCPVPSMAGCTCKVWCGVPPPPHPTLALAPHSLDLVFIWQADECIAAKLLILIGLQQTQGDGPCN